MHKLIKLLFFTFFVLSQNQVLAIQGDLLPPSELPEYVCVLKAEKRIDRTTSPDGTTRDEVKLNDPFCSAVLVNQNFLYSAAHCHPDQISRMHDHDEHHRVTEIILSGKITAECGKPKGIKETRELDPSQAFYNPLFQIDPHMEFTNADKTFDMSIWKFKDPILSITPVLVSKTSDQTLEILELNRKQNQCRSFGYGYTDSKHYGELSGAFTPICAASKSTLFSDLLPSDDHPARDGQKMLEGGVIAPGDSGGALICRDEKGNDVLLGIISRGREDFAPHSEFRTFVSIYSSPVFNGDFLQMAENNTSLGEKQKVAYERLECKKEQRDADAVLQKYQNEIMQKGEYEEMKRGFDEASHSLEDPASTSDALFKVYDALYFIEQHATQIGKNWL